jgi:hypothetical protein
MTVDGSTTSNAARARESAGQAVRAVNVSVGGNCQSGCAGSTAATRSIGTLVSAPAPS